MEVVYKFTQVSFSLLLLCSPAAFAKTKTPGITDIALETKGSRFQIRRFHHPLFQGYFGKGWCSDIDLKLSLLSERTVALKACRVLDPILFVFSKEKPEEKPEKKKQEGLPSWEASATNQPELSLKRIGSVWMLKNQGITIAQFNLSGKPIAMRSHHDGQSPSSEWLQFQYSAHGRLSEIGFTKENEQGARFMATVQTQSARIILKEDSEEIQEIHTPLKTLRYLYKGNHLTQIQDGQTKRSPD